MRLSQRLFESLARLAMPATSAWAGAPPSGANGQGWIQSSHQTRSLSTHGAFAPVECQTTLIFRVPGTFAHRVLVGNRVRVECNPATEIVTDVALLET